MHVHDWILNETKKRTLHFSLFDPDPKKMQLIEKKIKLVGEFGTDAILIGGSTNVSKKSAEKIIYFANQNKLPSILFPGRINGVSKKAIALLFMSLLNSRNPKWITGIQAEAGLMIKKADIETIPMGYIIVEPGGKVGKVGKANLIKRSEPEKAVGYAIAAQLMGMKLVYLEGGSGILEPIPEKIISCVKKELNIPLIVGGGIRTPKQAEKIAKAGADIIITGTVSEENVENVREIIRAIKKTKKWAMLMKSA